MTSQSLIINSAHPEESRIAIVTGSSLSDFFIETNAKGKFVGNIYKAIITHVQPNLQAAFVNYGLERNGFLSFSEIHPEYYTKDTEGKNPAHLRIQEVVQSGQEVLVQVVKEEVGSKGAVLTTYISLAGRYIVLMPGQNQRGVSRKIEDEAERDKLKELVRSLTVPDEFGLIIRTVAENRTKREISKDLESLLRLWEEIRKQVQEADAPALIYKERDLAIRVVRDHFNPNIKTILVDDKDVYRSVREFLGVVSPAHKSAVKLYTEEGPIFARHNIEEQIEQIFQKRVNLKSGGYLVVEPTEALVTIDVNSGRAKKEDEQDEMIFRVNMEAAAEIPRQLRLRDLGGLVVIDFIDMRDRRHIREVERKLREELKQDKAKITVGRISRFGLMELSRQHIGINIQQGSYRDCPHCQGIGLVRSTEAAALSYLRKIWLALGRKDAVAVRGTFSPEIAMYLLNQKRMDIIRLEERYQATITIEAAFDMAPHEGKLEWTAKEKEVPKEKEASKEKDAPKEKEASKGKEASKAKAPPKQKEAPKQKETSEGEKEEAPAPKKSRRTRRKKDSRKEKEPVTNEAAANEAEPQPVESELVESGSKVEEPEPGAEEAKPMEPKARSRSRRPRGRGRSSGRPKGEGAVADAGEASSTDAAPASPTDAAPSTTSGTETVPSAASGTLSEEVSPESASRSFPTDTAPAPQPHFTPDAEPPREEHEDFSGDGKPAPIEPEER